MSAVGWAAPTSLHFLMSEAVLRMVVDHTHCLYMGVDDGRAYELKAPLLQVFAERVGLRGCCGYLFKTFKRILLGLVAYEPPTVI